MDDEKRDKLYTLLSERVASLERAAALQSTAISNLDEGLRALLTLFDKLAARAN